MGRRSRRSVETKLLHDLGHNFVADKLISQVKLSEAIPEHQAVFRLGGAEAEAEYRRVQPDYLKCVYMSIETVRAKMREPPRVIDAHKVLTPEDMDELVRSGVWTHDDRQCFVLSDYTTLAEFNAYFEELEKYREKPGSTKKEKEEKYDDDGFLITSDSDEEDEGRKGGNKGESSQKRGSQALKDYEPYTSQTAGKAMQEAESFDWAEDVEEELERLGLTTVSSCNSNTNEGYITAAPTVTKEDDNKEEEVEETYANVKSTWSDDSSLEYEDVVAEGQQQEEWQKEALFLIELAIGKIISDADMTERLIKLSTSKGRLFFRGGDDAGKKE
ncbi:hypothetical protein F4778DRAFT_753229 [Xylariomycetidae sp. FL2044]|nr:hypothetical protein F4778DRAFT_753229 [Xylariomycetidae sp. FL2044]